MNKISKLVLAALIIAAPAQGMWDATKKYELQITLEGRFAGSLLCRLKNDNVALIADDNTIKILNPTSLNIEHTLRGHTGLIDALTELHDEKIVSYSHAAHELIIWDVTSHTFEKKNIILHRYSSLQESDDGRIICDSNHSIEILNLLSGAIELTLNDDRTFFAHSDKYIDGTLPVTFLNGGCSTYNLASGEEQILENDHNLRHCSVCRLQDGRIAFSSADHTIKIWNPLSKTIENTLKGHNDTIMSIIQLKNGNLASASYHDDAIIIWDIQSGMRQTFKYDKPLGLRERIDGTIHVRDITYWKLHDFYTDKFIEYNDGTIVASIPNGNNVYGKIIRVYKPKQ